MSKMQMLFFAVGIGAVAFMFLNFVSVVGLQRTADAVLSYDVKIVADQSTTDLLCSFKQTTIPDKLVYGVNSAPFFYDLEFIKQSVSSESIDNPSTNVLVMRVSEHQVQKANSLPDPTKKNIISAKSIISEAEFVLIDPGFLTDLTVIKANQYNVNSILLYPRAATIGANAASPNGFVALSEVVGGKKRIYVVPCATEKEPNNCLMNIFRVGCYKMTLLDNKTQDTPIDSCFNIILPSSDNSSKTKNYTWKDCVTMFPEYANN